MKQMSPVNPTLGRNIRYVIAEGPCKGESRAAIITQVWRGIPAYTHSEVNLTVFLDLANDCSRGVPNHACSVPYDPERSPGTWHWPADAGDGFPAPPCAAAIPDGSSAPDPETTLPREEAATPAATSASDTPPAPDNGSGSAPDSTPDSASTGADAGGD